MSPALKSRVLLALVAVLGLLAGYALPRPTRRGGDMLDAVAAVQRRSPRFLVSEPMPTPNWARSGTLYLCRTPRAALDLDSLLPDPGQEAPRWAGVVCFRGTADPNRLDAPRVQEGRDRCLRYRDFEVFGDPEVLQEVRAILDAEGFRPVPGPR